MSNCVTVKFGSYNPRRNLPPHLANKRGESNYVGAFERRFLSSQKTRGICGRYFAVSGYGIADFIWLAAKSNNELHTNSASLTAFEMKLQDWKRALQQAYRYSYFADEAVVVLPPTVARRAMQNLDLFKLLDIGLWSFDSNEFQIEVLFKPKHNSAKNQAAKEKALTLIRGRVNLC